MQHNTRRRTGARTRHPAEAITPINRVRLQRGVTLRELAERTGLAERTIRRCMAGGATCAVATWIRIAKALAVDPFEVWPALDGHPNVLIRRRQGDDDG